MYYILDIVCITYNILYMLYIVFIIYSIYYIYSVYNMYIYCIIQLYIYIYIYINENRKKILFFHVLGTIVFLIETDPLSLMRKEEMISSSL